MFDFLFGNAGGKLSKIIKVVTVLEMIVIILAGFFSCFETEEVLPLLVAIGMAIFIWLSSLFIIGLLDMMSDVNYIKNIVEYRARLKPNSNGASDLFNSSSADSSQTRVSSIGGWVCSNCGKTNQKDSVYCIHCGTKRNKW